jgi:hypothetical protein
VSEMGQVCCQSESTGQIRQDRLSSVLMSGALYVRGRHPALIRASATPVAHVRGNSASPSKERSVPGFRCTLRSQRLADAMIKAFHDIRAKYVSTWNMTLTIRERLILLSGSG